MSSQSENPQHDAPQYDADHYGADQHGADHHGAAADPHAPRDPHDEPSGPPYRAIAMVLLSAVVLAVGVGLVQLFGADDDETATATDEPTSQVEQNGQGGQGAGGEGAPGQAGQSGQDGQPGGPDGSAPGAPGPGEGQDGPPGDSAAPGEQPAGSVPGDVAPGTTNVPVQIFNNSNVTGLAARTGESLRETGFAVGDVANMPSNRGVVAESTAFYGTGPGEQQAAEAVAAQLGISAKPRPADMAGDAPGVIVIVTQDLDR